MTTQAPASIPQGQTWPAPARSLGALPARATLEAVGRVLFALFIFFTCFTFLKPSPYDFTAIPTMLLWFALGIRLHRGAVVFVALMLVYQVSILVALVPYLDEPLPVEWTTQSVYLAVTGVFFAMFFADDTQRRVTLALNAYLASCLFAAAAGILSYFGAFGGLFFTMDGRAAGVFEDPNVLGSFLILAALTLLHNLLTGATRRPLLSTGALVVVLGGIFLSFSRGSWAATVLGVATMAGLTFAANASPGIRRRIVITGAAALIGSAGLVAGLLSVEGVAERFADRAVVTKDYDEGETGRFGNQRRSIPLLMEQPEGFGPLRFRLRFGLEPHNSYIGAFANGGWPAGFAFLGLVLTTAFVGLRLCLRASPYQRAAQIVVPALLMFFLQALQIDIEKWRHVYMMLGMVWALEAARLRWARPSLSR